MLDKGMVVWACISDKSYNDARDNIGHYAYRITKYDEDNHYPVIDAQSILADRTIERALAERNEALDTVSEK